MHQHISDQGRGFYGFFLSGFPGARAWFRVRAVFGAAVLFLIFSAWAAHAQKGAVISFLPDAKAKLTISEASARSMAGGYQTYIPSFMAFSRLPNDFNGAVWLRFALGPTFERPSGPVRVDLGASLPGISRLYTPNENGGFTVMESLPSRGTFILPENEPFPDVFYARIDGAPDLWFRPVIGPAADPVPGMAGDVPAHLILAGVFGFAMLVLLIRYVRKAEEWRLWAAITAGCGVVAAVIPAAPPAGQAFAPLYAGAMMMPGLILVFFAHTARHLLASPRTMPGSDRLLVLYYLIGGALALLPLAPGFLWVSRYLPLAALLFIPLLPVAMISLSGSLNGGPAFLCACLLPLVGVAVSSWELTSVDASMIRGLGGLAGTALGLLVLAFTGTVRNGREETESAAGDVFDSLDKACPSADLVLGPVRPRVKPPAEEHPEGGTASEPAGLTAAAVPAAPAAAATSAEPAGRPAGQPAPAASAAEPDPAPEKTPETSMDDQEHYPELSLFSGHEEDTPPEPEPVPDPVPEPEEPAIAPPPPAKPEETPAVPAVPVRAPVPIAITDDGTEEPADAPSADTRPATPSFMSDAPLGNGRKILFDLPTLVREAYDGPALIAERKGLGMSWYIAPHTGRLFEGEADLLDSALRQLLRDMVEAMGKGNVRLNVRRMGNSADAGHIVFTVSEWDARQTSGARTMAGLAEAWSLAEKTGGMFSVEHSPAGGTTVIFSAAFAAMDKAAPETAETGETATCDTLPAGRTSLAVEAPSVRQFSDYPNLSTPRDQDPTVRPRRPRAVPAEHLAGETGTERDPLRVIVADTTASGRARASAALADSPYAVLECATPPAAHTLYSRHPSGLLLMNADMPEVDIAAAIKDIHADDARNGRSPALFAVLVEHGRQADRMMEAGAVRTLMKPVHAGDILALVTELLPVPDKTAKPGESAPFPMPPVANLMPEIRQSAAGPEPGPATAEPVPGPQPVRKAPLQVRVSSAPAPRQEKETLPVPQTGPETAPKPVPTPEGSQPSKAVISVKTPAKTVVAQSTSARTAAPVPVVARTAAPAPVAVQTAAPVPVAVQIAAPVPVAPVQDDIVASGASAVETAPKDSPAGTEPAASPETVLRDALADIPPMPENSQPVPAEINEQTEAGQSGIFSTALPADTPAAGEQPADTGGKTDDQAGPAPVKGAGNEPGLALLDMIITDEEEEPAPAAPKPEAEAEAGQPPQPAAPARDNAPGERQATPDPSPSANAEDSPPAPAPDPSGPKPEDTDQTRSENPAASADSNGSGGRTATQQAASILLPGEEDSIFKDMVPLVPGLIYELTDALADAARGREEKSPLLVQQAAARVAGKAESFGLTKLERIARCVERAAAADDIEPMECVLTDLENWIARYKEALTRVHRDMQW